MAVTVDGANTNPLQLLPFQCCAYATSVLLSAAVVYMPTTQTSLAEIATTPVRSLWNGPGFDVAMMVQLLPSQCSASVWS